MICNVKVSAATVNKKTRPNQDNLIIDKYVSCASGLSRFSTSLISDTSEVRLFAVADGVGGEASGDLASDTVVRTLYEYLGVLKKMENTYDELGKILDTVNMAVCEKFYGADIGASTLSGIILQKNRAVVFNLGDSPVYYLHNGILRRVEKTHTVKTPSEGKKSTDENTITRYMGNRDMSGSEQAYICEIPLSDGDIFLLCSDGIEKGLGEKNIKKILLKKNINNAQILVDKAYFSAEKEDCADDTTAIAIKIYV